MLGTQLQAIWNDETVRMLLNYACHDTSEKVPVTKVDSLICIDILPCNWVEEAYEHFVEMGGNMFYYAILC
jgi:hypothetical protein